MHYKNEKYKMKMRKRMSMKRGQNKKKRFRSTFHKMKKENASTKWTPEIIMKTLNIYNIVSNLRLRKENENVTK